VANRYIPSHHVGVAVPVLLWISSLRRPGRSSHDAPLALEDAAPLSSAGTVEDEETITRKLGLWLRRGDVDEL
jgi:hypothetical protein